MKNLTKKWWFWVLFGITLLILFISGVLMVKYKVDQEYKETTEFNKYLNEKYGKTQ